MTGHNEDAVAVRRALSGQDRDAVLADVDELQLRPQAGVDVVVVAPLRTLQRHRDLTTFCASAPWPAVRLLAELRSNDCLERVVAALGDAAESPTLEELTTAVDSLDPAVDPPATVATMLALAAAMQVPAAPHCRELLATRPELALPELAIAVGRPVAAAKSTDDAVRAERRERRQRERAARQRAQRAVPAPHKKKRVDPPAVGATPVAPKVAAAVVARRAVLLTPLETQRFDAAHPAAGSIVDVEVPFSDVDGAKHRPALVVAVNDEELLVRPIYSRPGPTRRPLNPWHRLGLAHESFIDDERVVVAAPEPLRPLGRLTDAEWNALL